MNPSKRRVLRRFRCFSRAAFTMALLSRWSRDSSATTSAASCLSARDVSFLAAARSRTARSTVAAAYGLRRPRWDRAQGVAYLSLRHSKRPPSTASSTESSQTCRAVSGNCRLRFESTPPPRPSSGGVARLLLHHVEKQASAALQVGDGASAILPAVAVSEARRASKFYFRTAARRSRATAL